MAQIQTLSRVVLTTRNLKIEDSEIIKNRLDNLSNDQLYMKYKIKMMSLKLEGNWLKRKPSFYIMHICALPSVMLLAFV